jgi:hypothetical protein
MKDGRKRVVVVDDLEGMAEMVRRLGRLYSVTEEKVIDGVLRGMRRNAGQRRSFSQVAARLMAYAVKHEWAQALQRVA